MTAESNPHADERVLATPDEVRTVTVRGRRLRVSVRPGDPERPPLLLCNGIEASLELLAPFVDALAVLDAAPEIIRFDMPGSGGSPPPVLPYHMTTLAPLIGGLLGKLGHDRVDVLGISWGGGLAQQVAAQCRRRVRRVVLVATGTGSVMVPARPGVLAKLLTPGGTATRNMPAASPASCTAAACVPGRSRLIGCCTRTPAPARSGATTTSCSPVPGGRACRCCRASANPP